MNPRHALVPALLLGLALPSTAAALPGVGAPMPAFSVEDIAGVRHDQTDLRGHWSVALVMTDKDVKDDIAAWWHRLEVTVPSAARMYTFGALNLFPLIPTAALISQARSSTPRHLWPTVWFSRDGSFATALGLPEEELPWVVVVDPAGRVALTVHERVSEQALQRVLSLLPGPSAPAPAAAP